MYTIRPLSILERPYGEAQMRAGLAEKFSVSSCSARLLNSETSHRATEMTDVSCGSSALGDECLLPGSEASLTAFRRGIRREDGRVATLMSLWKILWYGDAKKPEAIGTEARKQQTGLQIGVPFFRPPYPWDFEAT
jgi:hypothetical protein